MVQSHSKSQPVGPDIISTVRPSYSQHALFPQLARVHIEAITNNSIQHEAHLLARVLQQMLTHYSVCGGLLQQPLAELDKCDMNSWLTTTAGKLVPCVCVCVRACVRACVCVCEKQKSVRQLKSYYDLVQTVYESATVT